MSSRQNRNESNMTKLAVGAAVGALLGLAAYGVKKVYDTYEESKQQECAHGESSKVCKVDDDSDDDADYPSRNKPSTTHNASNSSNTSTSSHTDSGRDEPLQVQLEHYHRNYCTVPVWEMSRAKEVVDDVKKMLLTFSQQHLKGFRVLALRDTGSTEEELKVIKADEFDVMIHLQLDPDEWMLKEAENAAGYWAVAKKDTSEENRVADLCIAQYLNPGLVANHFQSLLESMVNIAFSKYQIRNSGPANSLSVTYTSHGLTKRLEINFLPAFNQNSVWVAAIPHPRASVIPGFENYWRQSFAPDEERHLTRNPNMEPNSCHLKCLRIMKAVRLNHLTQLGPLSSYAMKTVLMHMLDQEDDWTDRALSERIFDFLLALKQYLTARELPNYFCPEMNLLEGIRPETCDGIRTFIIRKLDQGVADMLKTDY